MRAVWRSAACLAGELQGGRFKGLSRLAVAPPPPLAAVPSEVFASEKILNLNRSTLHLKYYGPAHTDNDISVTFTEADILHCGDTFWNGFYPFIDYSSGGSIDGMIKAAEENVAAVSDKTIVIPGHNMPGPCP